jgi:hypothetical protein
VHTPAWHVDAQPAPHGVPLGRFGFEHAPVAGLQMASWHASPPVQATGLAPVHTPAWQVSVWVQALPSLQLVPFAIGGFEHAPVDGSHTPATWH